MAYRLIQCSWEVVPCGGPEWDIKVQWRPTESGVPTSGYWSVWRGSSVHVDHAASAVAALKQAADVLPGLYRDALLAAAADPPVIATD